MWVATKVQRAFTAYHRATAEEAVHNVRLVLERAAAASNHRTDASGRHLFWWKGFNLLVTRDLGPVVSYRTNHYERTPQMVADGVASRLRGAARGVRAAGRRSPRLVPAELAVGAILEGPVVAVVNFGAFVDLGPCDGLIHKSLMPGLDGHPSAFVSEGDRVAVEVVGIDRELGRVSLSFRSRID